MQIKNNAYILLIIFIWGCHDENINTENINLENWNQETLKKINIECEINKFDYKNNNEAPSSFIILDNKKIYTIEQKVNYFIKDRVYVYNFIKNLQPENVFKLIIYESYNVDKTFFIININDFSYSLCLYNNKTVELNCLGYNSDSIYADLFSNKKKITCTNDMDLKSGLSGMQILTEFKQNENSISHNTLFLWVY